MQATQVDTYETLETKPAFTLSAFGDDDIMQYISESMFAAELQYFIIIPEEISCLWSGNPFCVGRIKFLKVSTLNKKVLLFEIK